LAHPGNIMSPSNWAGAEGLGSGIFNHFLPRLLSLAGRARRVRLGGNFRGHVVLRSGRAGPALPPASHRVDPRTFIIVAYRHAFVKKNF
jgi:hypothetical protein